MSAAARLLRARYARRVATNQSAIATVAAAMIWAREMRTANVSSSRKRERKY